eukprot:26181-Chlamydomonas_euryale.AAC.6
MQQAQPAHRTTNAAWTQVCAKQDAALGIKRLLGSFLPPGSLSLPRLLFYWLFRIHNDIHIFCRSITIIVKNTINQAWTWIKSTPRLPVAH